MAADGTLTFETARRPYEAHFNYYRHPRLQPAVYEISIVGPYNPAGAGDTPSRRRVFTCRPLSLADETTCAADIVRKIATQAFRRPVSEKDHARLMSFYARGRKERNFEFGVTKAL